MNIDELWVIALNDLLNNESSSNARTAALNMVKPLGLNHNVFVLVSQNQVAADLINRQYLQDIEDAVSAANESPLKVSVFSNHTQEPIIENNSNQTAESQSSSIPSSQNTHQKMTVEDFQHLNSSKTPANTTLNEPEFMNTFVTPKKDIPPTIKKEHKKPIGKGELITRGNKALFSKCTFDSFVEGDSNSFAKNSALAVADQPGVCYNPLFLYGNSGLGKTHLMIAIANYIHSTQKNMSIVYASASDFLSDYVTYIGDTSKDVFYKKYRGKDVLLIDDVQYLAKRATESLNQLFNIFNEMTGSDKQVILSADRSPKYLNMDERIKSRFMSGMLADIKEPNYETRLAIIEQYYAYRQQTSTFVGQIPEEVLKYLAEHSSSNIREIEGSVTRLIGYMSLKRKETVSIEETAEIIKDFFPSKSKKTVTIPLIQELVEEKFNVSHEDIISSKRSRALTVPRHVAIYLARLLTEESLDSIGKSFGGRDHATIMYSVKKIEKELESNNQLMETIDELTMQAKRL